MIKIKISETIHFNHTKEGLVLTSRQEVIGTHFVEERLLKITPAGNVTTLRSIDPFKTWGLLINDK